MRSWILIFALLLSCSSLACSDDADEAPAAGGGGAGTGDSDAGPSSDGGGGGGGGEPIGDGIGDPGAKAKWTVFVYGHGDHNLSNSLVRDIVEMAEAEIGDQVRVVVLADFDASQELADTGEKFPSGAQWLLVEGEGQEPKTLGTEPELDLDDPEVLAGAVAAAYSQFPSERRALILWDHGGAWQGGFGGDTQNGRREQTSPMAASTVAEAIAAGLESAGLEPTSDAIDILSFDTCLMAGAEVAWEFRSLAAVYVANAEIDYGDGWDYSAFLTHLSTHLDDTATALAMVEVTQWNAHHESASANDTLLRSHIALDMTKLPAFGVAYDALVQTWLGSATLSGVELGAAAYFSLPPYMNQLENPTATPELRDVGQFLSQMTGVSDTAVAEAATAAHAALADATLGLAQGDIRSSSGQLGMHVQLPLAVNLSNDMLTAYRSIAASWDEQSAWSDALEAYAQLNDGVEPGITASIRNADAPDSANLPTVAFGSSDADVAEAEVNLAQVDPSAPDELLFFGIVGKGRIEPEQSYEFAWTGQITNLPDGQGGTQPVFVRIWEDAGGAPDASGNTGLLLATFGLIATPDGTETLCALLFQDGDEEAGLLTLFDPPVTIPIADVARDAPGSTFTPVLVSLSLSNGTETALSGAPIPLDQATLPLSAQPAPIGTYALITSITDVFGNAGSDLQVVNVPQSIVP